MIFTICAIRCNVFMVIRRFLLIRCLIFGTKVAFGLTQWGLVFIHVFRGYQLCSRCSWWRHQMETFSALLTWNSPVPGEFPSQRPVTRGVDVFFDLDLNKRLCKQSLVWWFETQSRPLWRQCNGRTNFQSQTSSNLMGTCFICYIYSDITIHR